jgi:hypothetical protein
VKGKVLVLSLIVTTAITIIAYKGYLDPKKTIEVNTYLVKFSCGEKNIDLRVTTVDDDSAKFLIGKTISPELSFAQTKLNKAIEQLLSNNINQEELVLIGYLRKSSHPHCSGSECFQVKKIKLKNANAFIEF